MTRESDAVTASRATPCAVVVDTRNVKGWLVDMFGSTSAKATARGIRRVVEMYGFDAVEVSAGVATSTPGTKPPSAKVADMLARNGKYRDELASGGVKVLEGYLVERGDRVDEKKVDVLLALQVADVVDRIRQGKTSAKCVVVLSEDMDLMPAYEYAAARGVQVYALADDTVYHREDQKKWLLLHEAAARGLGSEEDTQGTPVRSYLARQALGISRMGLPTRWKSLWDQRPGDVQLVNNKGVRGTYYSSGALMRGAALDLHPYAIQFPEKGPHFPQVVLSESPPAPGAMDGVHEARVAAWSEPTRVRAVFDDGAQCGIRVPPGSVLPGDRIAIWTTQRATGRAHYYIGPLSSLTFPAGWPHDSAIAVATIVSANGSTYWPARLDDGFLVQIQKTWLEHAGTGDRVAVALAGVDPETGDVRAVPLCCCLPK